MVIGRVEIFKKLLKGRIDIWYFTRNCKKIHSFVRKILQTFNMFGLGWRSRSKRVLKILSWPEIEQSGLEPDSSKILGNLFPENGIFHWDCLRKEALIDFRISPKYKIGRRSKKLMTLAYLKLITWKDAIAPINLLKHRRKHGRFEETIENFLKN